MFLFRKTVTNHLLTAKAQRSQRRWFFALAVRGRQNKSLRLFEAKALSINPLRSLRLCGGIRYREEGYWGIKRRKSVISCRPLRLIFPAFF